jgi:HK97 family phage prohead protease
MEDIERRVAMTAGAPGTRLKAESRADGTGRLEGYAAVYFDPSNPGTQFQLGKDVFERVLPGCFERALKEGDDCRLLLNHDPNFSLARTRSRTLALSSDKTGLRIRASLGKSPFAASVLESVQRGDVSEMSFAFIIDRQNWREEKQGDKTIAIRELLSVRLLDVSCVTYAAYEGTSVYARDNQPVAPVSGSTEDFVRQVKARMFEIEVLDRVAEIEAETQSWGIR